MQWPCGLLLSFLFAFVCERLYFHFGFNCDENSHVAHTKTFPKAGKVQSVFFQYIFLFVFFLIICFSLTRDAWQHCTTRKLGRLGRVGVRKTLISLM
uniref:Secreted protein n=1 Tax=Ixodes ricinus TaxID=34613 RepID=A0A6B0U4N0_IXORI